jgi:hypothetical protein
VSVGDPELSVNSDPDPTVKLITIHRGTVYAMFFVKVVIGTRRDCIVDIFIWNILESSQISSVCFFVLFTLA